MARRRRRQDEHENLERWLVSYADFITLLFAFFVVMYAVSSVNEGKYRVLSESLNAVFTVAPRSNEPIQVGERPRDVLALDDGPLAPQQTNLDPGGQPQDADQAFDDTAGGDAQRANDAAQVGSPQDGEQGGRFREDGATLRASDQLTIALQEYLEQGLVKITEGDGRVEIEMKSKMLFGSGDARLSPAALRALRELAESLKRIPSHLQIEGHTDDVPISTAAFPSNWELSAARAASVVHYLARTGIEPWRMAAVGLGEHRPIAENSDEQGRAANRRVTVVVLTGGREPVAPDDPDAGDVPWAEGPGMGVP
ncbi:MAG: flagellar motor protein MotD [Gammaproteobacteria bacterium]|nr:flagellar motor protein MotD [Gammaproteobacteria bacterium]